jgi:hypothetical protein
MHSIAGDSDAITAAIAYGFAILGYQIHQFQTSLDAAPGLLPAEPPGRGRIDTLSNSLRSPTVFVCEAIGDTSRR